MTRPLSPTAMSDAENEEPSINGNKKRISALELGPRKKAYVLSPPFLPVVYCIALIRHKF